MSSLMKSSIHCHNYHSESKLSQFRWPSGSSFLVMKSSLMRCMEESATAPRLSRDYNYATGILSLTSDLFGSASSIIRN